MALLDDITAEQGLPIVRCPVGKALRDLNGPDGEDLRFALKNPKKYTAIAIAKALRARSFDLDERAVRRHRRRGCACQG